MKRSALYLVVILCFALGTNAASLEILAQLKNLDGTTVEPRGIALDTVRGRIYWADSNGNRIQSCALSGGDVTTVVELDAAPLGIAVDAASKNLYFSVEWTQIQKARILRSKLDGSNIETLVTLPSYSYAESIALDIDDQLIYWTDPGKTALNPHGKLQSANFDGTDVETVLKLEHPEGIAVDSLTTKIFWTNADGDLLIVRMDGTRNKTLITSGTGGPKTPRGIALRASPYDVMYISDIGNGQIWSLNRDGTNVELVAEGLGLPYYLALDEPNGYLYYADPGTQPPQVGRIFVGVAKSASNQMIICWSLIAVLMAFAAANL